MSCTSSSFYNVSEIVHADEQSTSCLSVEMGGVLKFNLGVTTVSWGNATRNKSCGVTL